MEPKTRYLLQPRSFRRAGLAFIAAGLLMAVFWLVYTYVHGPTSFDETRIVLGRSTLFWSLLLSVPPALLLVLALALLFPILARDAGRMSRVGFTLVLMGLLVPVVPELFIFGGIAPPILVPFVGLGLILLAQGNRDELRLPGQTRTLLLAIGISMLLAFLLALFPSSYDRFGSYRVYGFLAHFLPGIGWAALGARFTR